jgi:hypothetical protein
MTKDDAYTTQVAIPAGRVVAMDLGGSKRTFGYPCQLRSVQPFVKYTDDDFSGLPSRIWPMPSYMEILNPEGQAVCRITEGSFDPVSATITAKPEAVQFFEV